MIEIAVTPRSFRATAGSHLRLMDEYGLAARFPDNDRPLNELEMTDFVRGCVGLIVGLDEVTEAVLDAGPLRAVVKFGAGTDNIDMAAARRRGVPVSTTAGANARSVAEMVVALVLALARRVVVHDHRVRRGRWERDTGVELAGKRLGIIGFGAVGREVARLGSALGMDVIAHDPFVEIKGVRAVALDHLLASSDVVSLHVPLTNATRGLIGTRELSSMRPGAFLVNTARGGLVDESALTSALAGGIIAGAAFDAFVDEPPVGSPLLELENFVASPHAGAATREAVERTGAAAVEELVRALGAEARNGGDKEGRR